MNESHDPRFAKTSPKDSVFRDVAKRINGGIPKPILIRTIDESYRFPTETVVLVFLITLASLLFFCHI